ncbi:MULTISPECIES: RraA family protein [unclassified Ornithinimicrobium]|uniref:RraA family protein n=1 Tax=unclassified Ornithinimicrobium TaxID=2615080 RepID=UPI003853B52B
MGTDDPGAARQRALTLGCAPLVDAMARRHGHRAHLPALTSPRPPRVLFGPVVTLAFLPTRAGLAGGEPAFGAVAADALRDGPSGAVLVLGSGGYPFVSHAGGTKLAQAAAAGAAGLLCDGLLRDFGELVALDLPVWCRGEAVRWGGDSVMPFAANAPVEAFGVTVVPGDWVYVDSAGGVVVPGTDLDAVLDEAERVVAEDVAELERLRGR